MLSIKLNRDNLKREVTTININSSACTYDYANGILTLPLMENDNNLNIGATVYIAREDGSDISYRQPCTIQSITGNVLTVNYQYINTLTPIRVRKLTDNVVPMQAPMDFLSLTFPIHYFRKNRDGLVIEEILDSSYTFDQKDVECIDYKNFTYNERYLYKSKWKDEDGKYIIEAQLRENYEDITFHNGTAYTMTDGVIPMVGLRDSRQDIYFPWDESYKTIVSDGIRLTYTFNDPRFFDIEMDGSVAFRDGVTILREDNPILQIGLGQTFTPNISIGEDIVDNYVGKRIEKGVNKIIDYEKKMFEPVYVTNTSYTGTSFVAKDIEKINFNLYFRDRKIADDWSDWYIRDANEWTGLTDTPIWNRDRYTETGTTQPLYGDPLGVIGFDDNDVYNRNKRLSKSFIRLSFFDSPDRKKQVLQFYSTIFFDTTEMYDRYMRNRNSEMTGKTENNNYTDLVQKDEKYSLSCTFSCYGKKEAMKSSEGFYLYLYDSLLEGTKPTPLYMLVEFNHALFGKTIPLMMPTVERLGRGLEPLAYTDPSFPRDYQATGSAVGQITPYHIDMTRFYKDLFIKVYVKYDNIGKRYIWYLPRVMNDNTWTFNLYEPNINPIGK